MIIPREVEALARRLAAAQHVSVPEAVRLAIEEKARAIGVLAAAPARRDRSPGAVAARRAAVAKFVEEISAMPVRDGRPLQDIMDDLNGL